jgi:uncharacterized repeat protein (TIGR01451 family)
MTITTQNDPDNWTVTVTNPNGGRSNAFPFTVIAPTPAIASLVTNPSAPTTGTFIFTINGNNFYPAGAQILVTGPGCAPCTIPNGVLTTKTTATLSGPATLNTAGIYSFVVQNGFLAQNGAPGPRSGGASVTVGHGIGPTITSTPPSGPQGTTFTTTGSGFTPNGLVRRFFIVPGQNHINELGEIAANGAGQINWPFTSQCTDAIGQRPLWTRDDATNQESNHVIQSITASTGCTTVTVSRISPDTPIAGAGNQTVTVSGSGFQTGLTVTAFFPNNGGTATLQGVGQIQGATPTGFQIQLALNSAGTWGIRVNNPSGQQSNIFNFVVVDQSTQAWSKVTCADPSKCPVAAGTAHLLTDGSVMVHDNMSSNWFRLIPNAFGSYENGLWSRLQSMESRYAPLYFSSAVLGDGRVVVIGGEYNNNLPEDTNLGAIYNPTSDIWTPLSAPTGWTSVGDANNVVLPSGEFLLGHYNSKQLSKLDPLTLTWTNLNSTNKADNDAEEGWVLLPDGTILTVDTQNGTQSEKYNPSTDSWTTTGDIRVALTTNNGVTRYVPEVGPQILRPDGTVFVAGATGHTAVYNVASGTWTGGPDLVSAGRQLAVADGPAALLPNGKVLVGASTFGATTGDADLLWEPPTKFFEFDGTRLAELPAPNHGSEVRTFQTRMLLLPTGQVLYTDGSRTIEIFTSDGSPNPSWAPSIITAPSTVQLGQSYTITGTQFNGLSQGAAYGDDAQAATNYPLVRITNSATRHVFYARTHNHSTMGVATGSTPVSTRFDVPSMETGPSTLVVVANGIASSPWPLNVISAGPDLTITMVHSGNFTQGQISAAYTITGNNVGSAATSGLVTVSDTLPTGLTATAISGNGWTCAQPAGPCTRLDALPSNGSYPSITLTVNVAGDAPASLINTASVAGGGEINTSNNSASDPTTIPSLSSPAWTLNVSHVGNFAQVQTGASYSITVTNSALASRTSAPVTVTETIPNGLILVAMYGTGWNCSGVSCTRSDPIHGGVSYPNVTVIVNVAPNAPSQLSNQVSVEGGAPGPGTPAAIATDATIINPNPPFLTISKTHTGNFTQRQTGATYTIAVSNGGPAGPTSGTVTVTETVPSGLTLVSMAGTGWTCPSGGSACTRSDVLGGGTSYPAITVTVNVGASAASPQVNSVSVSGGGSATATAADSTMIVIAGPALRFVPVPPCRVADTRLAAGPFGAPALAAGISRDFVLPAGPCAGIPANASAYSLNLTVVPLGGLGFLSVWPAGQPQPVVSTLNSTDGRVKANAAIVPAGVSGAITVFATNSTHLIIDINGYFVPAIGVQNLAFYPVTPCRVADTRLTTGTFGGPALAPLVPRNIPVSASPCGIPATAQAYAVNMTVVPFSGLGYLATWPAGSPRPLVSTLNDTTGTVVANAAIVPAGVNGAITVFATDATHLIVDINGYFAPPGAGSLDFFTATPCRIVDTRLAGPNGGPVMGAGQTRSFLVPSSACGIPATAKAYSLNATVVPTTSLGFLTLWGSGVFPLASTLNATDGTIVANAALVPAGASGAVTAFTTHQSHLILDINGYFQ